MSQPLKPMVKWSGGKGDEISKFIEHIPANYDTYLEPFIGGGATYFHLAPSKAVITDVHSELIDFYTAIKNKKSEKPTVVLAVCIKGKGIKEIEGHGQWHHKLPNESDYKKFVEILKKRKS